MSKPNKPEQKESMTEQERQERLQRVHEFWWGRRPPAREEDEKGKQK